MDEKPVPVVRYATPRDYEQIIQLATELHEENGHQAIDFEIACPVIMNAINRKQSVIGLIGPVGAIEGIVFLRFASMWHTRELFLEEIFVYVVPQFRQGTGNARALIEFMKRMSDELSLPLMTGVMSSHRTKAKLKLYEKHLGEPVGGYFFKYPKNWGK
jgi:hypothetical protein